MTNNERVLISCLSEVEQEREYQTKMCEIAEGNYQQVLALLHTIDSFYVGQTGKRKLPLSEKQFTKFCKTYNITL